MSPRSAWTSGVMLVAGSLGCIPGELFLAGPDVGAELADGAHAEGAHLEDGRAEAGETGSCPNPADCADPACAAEGYRCVAPPPNGWIIAAVDFKNEAPCPRGYRPVEKLVSAPTGGAASCGCNCSVTTAPTCDDGTIDYSIGATASCPMPDSILSGGGACTSATLYTAPYIQVTKIPGPTGGTCGGTASVTLPPDGSKPYYVCPLDVTPSSTGCSAGQYCVASGVTQSQCIIRAGTASCPAPYARQQVVGTSVDDTRRCIGSCTCGAPTSTACVKPEWTFYSGAKCTGTSLSVDMNGSCDAPSVIEILMSYTYSATATGTECGAPASIPTASGSLSLAAEQTLCCLP